MKIPTIPYLSATVLLAAVLVHAEETSLRTATLYPEADTYIQANSQNANFGAATFLSAAGARLAGRASRSTST